MAARVWCQSMFWWSPEKQQDKAVENMNGWMAANNITVDQIKRANCAHDSDGDGWATCTVVTKPSGEEQGEHISLQCVTGWLKDKMGASGCKEVDGNFKTTRGRPQ
jgi:hypothetical protein